MIEPQMVTKISYMFSGDIFLEKEEGVRVTTTQEWRGSSASCMIKSFFKGKKLNRFQEVKNTLQKFFDSHPK